MVIVPARLGSLRLPGKNKLLLGNETLLFRTYRIIKKLDLIKSTIFTSDDDDLISEALSLGMISPGKRPEHLSNDESKSIDVVKYLLSWAKKTSWTPDLLLFLQLTSPFRDFNKIKKAINIITKSKNISGIVSGVFSNSKSEKTIGLSEDLLYKNNEIILGKYIQADGNFYLLKTEKLLEENSFFPIGIKVLISNSQEAIDIDYYKDFLKASQFYNQIKNDKDNVYI